MFVLDAADEAAGEGTELDAVTSFYDDRPLHNRMALLARITELEAQLDSAVQELALAQERVQLADDQRAGWLALYQAASDFMALVKVGATGTVYLVSNAGYTNAQAACALETALAIIEETDAVETD